MKLCLVKNKGEKALSFNIEGEAISVGRSSLNTIQINDKHVSRNHLMVWKKGNRYLLKDLGSGNGTSVNGHRVPPDATVEVKEGDDIVVGMSVFYLGKGRSGDIFAFLDAVKFHKQGESGTGTVILADTFISA
jgi:pSer/pThr/pTyr-binding forkhead associated (FHA) protein